MSARTLTLALVWIFWVLAIGVVVLGLGSLYAWRVGVL